MRYVVFGAGTPVVVDSYSPEVAEAVVVEEFGGDIERLVTVEEDLSDLLS